MCTSQCKTLDKPTLLYLNLERWTMGYTFEYEQLEHYKELASEIFGLEVEDPKQFRHRQQGFPVVCKVSFLDAEKAAVKVLGSLRVPPSCRPGDPGSMTDASKVWIALIT